MDNCYDTNSDINIFADTKNIVITLQSTQQSQCRFPAGILVSLQLDGIDSNYEPQAYVYDYDYNTTTTITIPCVDSTNPLSSTCTDLYLATTGQIIFESKIEKTIVSAGSVRISRG